MTQSAQKTLRDYLQETEDAISKGRMDNAESNCQHILAQFPESLEAQRLLGEIYLAKEAMKEAQQAFDWVLTNDPENVIAYCDRALISERQGDYDTSLDCYQQAYELSRGNSKIRQEFNKLSQKTGQQGFMLSRAGLARLYMRGDLLTQAIQEWEAVLASTPERLDARTGLLETYWREGLYERVEQLAAQILQDVPGCEKALLLLAYVTSLKSKTQAQDLIRRVESLDPDLLMAHDLFSDLFASQPAEPFLDLLKKPPVTLTPLIEASKNALPAPGEIAGLSANITTSESSSSSTWESLQHWQGNSSNEINRAMPEVPLDPPALPIWPENQEANALPWSEFVAGMSEERSIPQLEEKPAAQSVQRTEMQPEGNGWNRSDRQEEAAMEYPEAQSEPWETLQDVLSKVNAEGGSISSLSPEIWATLDQYLQTSTGRDETQLPNREESAAPKIVLPEPIKGAEPAAPSWMTALSQPERRKSGALNEATLSQSDWQNQMAEAIVDTPREASPAQPSWSMPWQQNNQPQTPTASAASPVAPEIDNPQVTPTRTDSPKVTPTRKEDSKPAPEPSEEATDDEDSFFGPAWLRSLGATELEGEEEEAEHEKEAPGVPEAAAPALSTPPQQDSWSSQPQQEDSWSSQPQQEGPWSSSTPIEDDSSWRDMLNQTPEMQAEENSIVPPDEGPSWMSALQPAAQEQQDPSWIDALRQSSEPAWLSSLQQAGEPSWMDALQQEAEPKQNGASVQENAPPVAEGKEYNWETPFGTTAEPDWTSNVTPYGRDTNWMQSMDEAALPSLDQSDDPLLTTLRELEQGLMAQGFVPLEPNSLSSLAQATEQAGVAEQTTPLTIAEEKKQQGEAEPSLSSALAELGGFSAQARENQPVSMAEESWMQEMPTWAAAMSTVPTPLPVETEETKPAKQEPPVMPATPDTVWQRMPAQPAYTTTPASQPAAYSSTPVVQPAYTTAQPVQPAAYTTPASQPAAYNSTPATQPAAYNATPSAQPAAYNPTPAVQPYNATPATQPAAYNATPSTRSANNTRRPSESPTRDESVAGLNFRPTPVPAEATRAPMMHIDPLLDSELETTMKRPAIRLQPMQQRAGNARDQKEQANAPYVRGRTGERNVASRGSEQGASNQERLVTGYQHQLVGDYDEAMQEYRIIIRNSPDLLGEVISNVRALLKLAPKYAAGYRVLGDAYMRQGEYLQAMEAYNKALTIAKKKA